MIIQTRTDIQDCGRPAGELTLVYGTEYELFLDVRDATMRPVDVESLGCAYWTALVTPTLETPSTVLAEAAMFENVAKADRIGLYGLSLSSAECYRAVAGAGRVEAWLQVAGYIAEGDPTAMFRLNVPVCLQASSTERRPVDVSSELMARLQVGAAQAQAYGTAAAAARDAVVAADARAVAVNEEALATLARAEELVDQATADASDALVARDEAQAAQAAAEAAQAAAEAAMESASRHEDDAKFYRDAAEDAADAAHASELAAQSAAAGSAKAVSDALHAEFDASLAALDDAVDSAERSAGAAAQSATDAARSARAADAAFGYANTARLAAEDAAAAARENEQDTARYAAAAENQAALATGAKDAAQAAASTAASDTATALRAELEPLAARMTEALDAAEQYATDAGQSATGAASSAQTAQSAADGADAYANTSRTWAEGSDSAVADLGGGHSAREWARQAGEVVRAAVGPAVEQATAAAAASAESASASAAAAAEDASDAAVWAEGTDAKVAALGGKHSARRWSELAAASVDGKADVDGYYSTLGAGTAENLVDAKATGTSRQFTYDTACGDASITDDGTATIESIRGSTMVRNQLVGESGERIASGDGAVDAPLAVGVAPARAAFFGRTLCRNQLVANGDFSEGTDGWTVKSTVDGLTVTQPTSASGYAYASFTATAAGGCCERSVSGLVVGHHYIALVRITAPYTAVNLRVLQNNATVVAKSVTGTAAAWVCATFDSVADSCQLRVADYATEDWKKVSVARMQLVDLTLLFGGDTTAAAAVTSPESLGAVLPAYVGRVVQVEGYVPFDTGTLVSSAATWTLNPVKQLINAASMQKFSNHGVTFESTGDVVHVYGQKESGQYQALSNPIGISPFDMVPDHKYLYCGVPEDTRIFLEMFSDRVHPGDIFVGTRFQPGRAPAYPRFVVFHTDALDATFCPKLLDLTDAFGAGNEPTTYEDAVARFAAWGVDIGTDAPLSHGVHGVTVDLGASDIGALHGVSGGRDNYNAGAYDAYDAVTGQVIRATGTYTFTGNESVAISNWAPTDGYYALCLSRKNFPDLTYVWTGQPRAAIICEGIATVQYNANAGEVSIKDSFGIAAYTVNNVYGLFVRVPTSIATDDAGVLAWLRGRTMVYARLDDVSEEAAPQPLALQAGTNRLLQVSGDIASTPAELRYAATSWTVPASSSAKYLLRRSGAADAVVSGQSSIDVSAGDLLVDLTHWFGPGQEPATVDAFYTLFPQWRGVSVPFDPGAVINYSGTGIRTVGFNLMDAAGRTAGFLSGASQSNRRAWDFGKYYAGVSVNNYYYPQLVTASVTQDGTWTVTSISNSYGVALPFRVFPGDKYQTTCSMDGGRLGHGFFDASGALLSYTTGYNSGLVFEAPSGAYSMILVLLPKTNNVEATFSDLCVHLTWSGYRNGEYEKYWEFERRLPIADRFPNGMDAVFGAADELTAERATARIHRVSLDGTEDWEPVNTAAGSGYLLRDVLPEEYTGEPLMCNWFQTRSAVRGVQASNVVVAGVDSDRSVRIMATSSSAPLPTRWTNALGRTDEMSLARFREDLAARPLAIRLAGTPVESAAPAGMNLTYRVADFGTEESLPPNTAALERAPFSGMVRYNSDFTRAIATLPKNYLSADSLDALLAMLGQRLGGTITRTWDDAHGRYTFAFTED